MASQVTGSPLQIKDYLEQVSLFSEKEGLPKIIQRTISDALSVSSSTVSRFLHNPSVGILSKNFVQKFPNEVAKWPKNSTSIGRALTKADVCFFLNIPLIPAVALQPKVKPVWGRPTKASLVISYRGNADKDGKDGLGMIYDHMSYQKSTNHPSTITSPGYIKERVASIFKAAVKQNVSSLAYGQINSEGKKIPARIGESYKGGLLIIPGRVHSTENEPIRLEHEYKIIREALNRGQPILGICAGAWRVWEQALIFNDPPQPLKKGIEPLNANPSELVHWHEKNSTLIEVQDHCYNGGMLRLDQEGAYATFNVQMHAIQTEEDSLLQKAMKASGQLSVNSVHWNAVNSQKTPTNFRISAWSKENPSIVINNRQGKRMEPQEDTAEAFESISGAPVMGIQWHPEGYTMHLHPDLKKAKKAADNSPLHVNLLTYMALAGDAYQAKCAMLEEFKLNPLYLARQSLELWKRKGL